MTDGIEGPHGVREQDEPPLRPDGRGYVDGTSRVAGVDTADPEAAAKVKIAAALEGLTPEARVRVLARLRDQLTP